MACNCEYDCVESRLSKLFNRYGRFIGKHPLWFLIVPILVAMALASGMVFFHQNTDVEYLFTPEGSQAMKDRDRAEELFPLNDDDEFDAVRQNTLGRYGRLIVTAKDGGNVLSEGILLEIIELHNYVTKIEISDDGQKYKFEDLCGKFDGSCNENAILDLYNYDASNVNNGNLTYPLHVVNPVQRFIGSGLGGVQFYDDDETIKSVDAMQLFYFLKHDHDNDERRSKAWELEFLDEIPKYESKDINIAYFTSQTQELELAESSLSVIPLFSITFTVLITFSIICCVMADWVRSKPWLGQLGVLSAGLAVISSLGLCSYCGLPFINVVASMPFLILGIGVDDMFIMIAAWRRTAPSKSVVERMGEAYSEAAMSITITSITDFLAFCIGAITTFPSVRIFCIYTGVAVLFDYAYQITFFGACMALMGKREEANRHCMTCMKVRPKDDDSNSKSYSLFCAGGTSKSKTSNEIHDHAVMKFFQKQYGPFITKVPVKILTLLVFAGYLGVAIWGCTQLQEGIRLKNLANDDSYAVEFYNLEDEYFKVYGPAVAIVIDEKLKYSDSKVQEEIEKITLDLEESDYFHDNSDVTQSWLRTFLKFMADNSLTYTDEESFILNLRDHFLPVVNPYKIDINFNNDNTSIESSRVYVFSKDMNTANRERQMMIDARRIVEKSNFTMFTFHPAFIFYEQYIAVLPNTLQNIGIAAAAMFLVSLILIPHPICSIYVTFAIATISVGVVGFMTLWNVRLDSISMINIIICIGFSVDFSAHITYAFVIAKRINRDERAIEALYSLGWPILQGALSTILGVVALSTSDSYIFRTFFKTMFLVIFIGAVHGLVFLPVILTLLGPCNSGRVSPSDHDDPKSESYIAESVKTIELEGHTNPVMGDDIEMRGEGDGKESNTQSENGATKLSAEDLTSSPGEDTKIKTPPPLPQ
ncbi:patched domain-containing protein 3-like [Glandiceps talaboti]